MKLSAHQTRIDNQVATVACLGEPVRRRLYRYVAGQPDPVSREQAAAGVGVAHHVAKFHLDKLEADGLLAIEFRRPSGRSGPGAGRPTKFYRRAPREVAVSLPERRYDLLGRVMAEAITTSTASAEPVSATLPLAAQAAGRKLGQQARERTGTGSEPDGDRQGRLPRVGRQRLRAPGRSGRESRCSNCPFHRLAEDSTWISRAD